QFQYAYRQVSGDVTVIARVASVENVFEWTKAGVMIRGSLAGDAANATIVLTPSNGASFQRRLTNGSSTSYNKTPGQTPQAPQWVKLERRGTTITAFYSADGTTWTTLGTASVTLPSTFYVGLAVTSHNASRTATAVF